MKAKRRATGIGRVANRGPRDDWYWGCLRYVCKQCQRTASRSASNNRSMAKCDRLSNHRIGHCSAAPLCPECGEPMQFVMPTVRIPKRGDAKAWANIRTWRRA